MLLKDFLKEGISRLEPLYPAAEARNNLVLLCEYRLGTSRYTHLVDPEYTIKPHFLPGLLKDLDRLSSGEPVQYVTGYAEFRGRRFMVNKDVLVPRPETELLCEEAVRIGTGLRRKREVYGESGPLRILDLCTGSGCIAWSMALDIPGSEVYGMDISEKALAVALEQDFSAGMKESGAIVPTFMIADVLGDPPSFEGLKFDIILSNPPYILESQKKDLRSNVLDFEPHLALFVSDDEPLVFYRAVARWSKVLLADGGTGMVEINELLGPQTREVFLDYGFTRVDVRNDFSGKNRFISFAK